MVLSAWEEAARRRTHSVCARLASTIITLPKTIDNDVAMTYATFGYATALGIATDAVDRLHSTAHSHPFHTNPASQRRRNS
jgi:6-phosphofructokinase